jgi:hypothetical protein
MCFLISLIANRMQPLKMILPIRMYGLFYRSGDKNTILIPKNRNASSFKTRTIFNVQVSEQSESNDILLQLLMRDY